MYWFSSHLYQSLLNGTSSWVTSSTAYFASLFFVNVTRLEILGRIVANEEVLVSLCSLCNCERDSVDCHVAFAFIIEVVPVVSELVQVISGDVELCWFEGEREVTTDANRHVMSI